MSYVDGFVVPVPKDNKEIYRDTAARAWTLFQELGALELFECWGTDVPDGKTTDFKRAVKAEADEVVVFSWIVWPSKEVRDAARVKMANDPRMQTPMPFDGKRMIYGGFEPILESRRSR